MEIIKITIHLFKMQSERCSELSQVSRLSFARIRRLLHLNDESELYIKLK